MQLPCLSRRATEMKTSCHISSHTVAKQIEWVPCIYKPHPTPSIFLCHYISPLLAPPPPLPFPWKCQGESLFAVIRGSATFNQPLSQMSPQYIIHIWPDLWQTHGGGDYWRTQQEVSFKTGFNRKLAAPFVHPSAKRIMWRDPFPFSQGRVCVFWSYNSVFFILFFVHCVLQKFLINQCKERAKSESTEGWAGCLDRSHWEFSLWGPEFVCRFYNQESRVVFFFL